MKIAVIDLDSLAFAAGSPNKVLGENNEPIKENGKFVYTDKTEDELKNSVHYWMNEILTKSEATHYIAFIKGKGNYRYEIKSDYKANRPKESPKWWDFIKNDFIEEYKAIPVDGIEVDDAVNITRLALRDSFICAIDKDLLGLEGSHYNWRKNEWVYTNKVEAVYNFWVDMIAGQSGDAVKGIPGKGEKFVQKLFDGCNSAEEYRPLVLEAYISHFGEGVGIKEFYKNYSCLKILEGFEGFVIPEPISVKKEGVL